MARLNINVTARPTTTSPAGFHGTVNNSAEPDALATTADTTVDTVIVSNDATKVASAALETDAIALDALVDTAVAALAVLQADGALPTEAHVDTADTAVLAVKTASAAVETDAIALDALVDTTVVDADAAKTASAAIAAALGADIQVSINLATVTSRSQARALMKLIDQQIENMGALGA